MKISVITVVLNAVGTVQQALESVAVQDFEDIEHIVIDGGSSDGTVEILEKFSSQINWVSEPDDGLYDAMNKGIAMATGEVVGILNADDVYENNTVLSQVAEAHENGDLDACYADLVYVKANDLSAVVRNWRSRSHHQGLCWRGWMPAHPTLFIKRRVYEQVGGFDTSLKYQSDLEFCARLFEIHQISSLYIPELWVRMRLGGVTNNSFRTMLAGNWESYQALRRLGLKRDPLSYFVIKFSSRLRQFL